MPKTTKLFYTYIVSILIIFWSIELPLEYRHYRLGYNTPIFGKKNNSVDPDTQNLNSTTSATLINLRKINFSYGPTESFPFRSIILNKKKEGIRIWIASASHAVGGRIPASKIFPNLICKQIVHKLPCEVINGSMIGMNITEDIALLQKYVDEYRPDYAILYQMSMFLAQQQELITGKATEEHDNNNSIIDFSPAYTIFQSSSLYVHLSDIIGGNLELQGQLKNHLPKNADSDFLHKIRNFVLACKKLGVIPILSTFAASHSTDNLNTMPFTKKTNFVKWVSTPYLSPEGWTNSIPHFNSIIRSVALEQNIPLIDISKIMNGKYKYFIDFVHFNEMGHSEVAKIISEKLNLILMRPKATYDI